MDSFAFNTTIWLAQLSSMPSIIISGSSNCFFMTTGKVTSYIYYYYIATFALLQTFSSPTENCTRTKLEMVQAAAYSRAEANMILHPLSQIFHGWFYLHAPTYLSFKLCMLQSKRSLSVCYSLYMHFYFVC